MDKPGIVEVIEEALGRIRADYSYQPDDGSDVRCRMCDGQYVANWPGIAHEEI